MDGKKGIENFGMTPMEFDALKETANIGTGNASIALSNIFKKRVDISLPIMELCGIVDLPKKFAGPKEMIVGIYSKINEGMQGSILMIMPINSALGITGVFTNLNEKKDNLSETDKEVLKKVGTAVYASYLTALAKFFEKKIAFSPPNITSSYGDSMIDFITLQVGNVDEVLLIKLGFNIEGTSIKGDFLLLFTLDSLTPILESIRKKTN